MKLSKTQKEILQNQLNNEKGIMKSLKEQYSEALEQINNKITSYQSQIGVLQQGDTSDPVIASMIQSKAYQKQYQQALKDQISGILDTLNGKQFDSISDYLTQCYQNGFIGVAYDLASQGIPLIMPIDQAAVVQAISTNSKLSKGLYESLGENVSDMKKKVVQEITRGVASNLPYADIARNIAGRSNAGMNNSMRIARTEGQRIQNTAAYDAQVKAKEKGADVFKQWCAVLDGRTRDSHRQLDGKIVDVEEEFKIGGMSAMFPGDFGDPAEDCNCRCTILQRARWELDESELETLKERAEYFGLDKTEDFEEFKNKYLGISEKDIEEYEKQYGIPYGEDAKNVDFDYINSDEYKEKFSHITDNQDVNNSIYETTKKMLEHCNGTDHEDMYLFNANDGSIYAQVTNTDVASGIIYTDEFKAKLAESKENNIPIIALHNHPQGTPPSADDYRKAYDNVYTLGIVAGHNGQLYIYEPPLNPISKELADGMSSDIDVLVKGGIDIDRACEMVYNANEIKYTILKGRDS